ADLPLATDLTWLPRFPGVTLVPDRRDDGTNVLCVPTGPGSASRTGRGRSTVTGRRRRVSACRSVSCVLPCWPGTSTCPPTSTSAEGGRRPSPLRLPPSGGAASDAHWVQLARTQGSARTRRRFSGRLHLAAA